MKTKVVIKPSKAETDNGIKYKPFEVEILDADLQTRLEINKLHSKAVEQKTFDLQYAVDIIKVGTDWSDEDINQYSNMQMYSIVGEIVNQSMLEKKKK